MLDDDKDDQDILDQHVSRVWADRTPHRSPGNLSPGNQFNQAFRRKPYDIHLAAGGSKLKNHKIILNLIFILEFRCSIVNTMFKVNAGIKYSEIYKMG